MRSLSSSIALPCLGGMVDRRVDQRGIAAERGGILPSILRAGLRGLAARQRIEDLLEGCRREVLIGVAADQDHRGVDAAAQALDLLPGEIAVRRDVGLIVM